MSDASRQNRSGQKEVNSSRAHAFLWAIVLMAVVSGAIVYAAEQAQRTVPPRILPDKVSQQFSLLSGDIETLQMSVRELRQARNLQNLQDKQGRMGNSVAGLQANVDELQERLNNLHNYSESEVVRWAESAVQSSDSLIATVTLIVTIGGTLAAFLLAGFFFTIRERAKNELESAKNEWERATSQQKEKFNDMHIKFEELRRTIEQDAAKLSEKCNKDVARIKELLERAESKADIIDKLARDRTSDGIVWNDVRREEVDTVAADESAPFLKRLTAKALQAESKEDWQRAVTHWQTLVAETPKDLEAHFRLGYCAQSMAEEEPTRKVFWLQKAAEHYEHVIAIEPRHAAAYNNWGVALCEWAKLSSGEEQAERFAEACRKYEKATSLNPEHVDAYNNWGNALLAWARLSSGDEQAERFAEACRKYHTATTLNPEHALAYYNWGNALGDWAEVSSGDEQAGRFAEACRKYEKATSLNPEYVDAYNNWGNALLAWARLSSGEEQAGRFAEACRKYEKATTLNPEHALAYNNWGNALGDWAEVSSGDEQARRFAEACRKYEKATTLNPEYADAYNNWGIALGKWAKISSGEEQIERFAEACRKYDRATTLNPEYAATYSNWGNALGSWAKISSGEEQAERFAEACRKYEKATTLNPEDADAYNNWGAALLEWAQLSSGNEQTTFLDQAQEKLRKAEELRPGIGAYNLACVAALRGQPDTCRHWLATTYQHQDTPTADHLASDTDLVAVRDQQWFTDLVAERRRIESGERAGGAQADHPDSPDTN